MTDRREALVAHLMEHSIRTGEFTLKSGRTSTWFCDAKQTACRPEGILLVAEAALEAIAVLEVDGDPITAIGGLTAGADPVAFGIAAVAAARGRHLRSFSIRKESKGTAWRGGWPAPCFPGTGSWCARTPSPAACHRWRPQRWSVTWVPFRWR